MSTYPVPLAEIEVGQVVLLTPKAHQMLGMGEREAEQFAWHHREVEGIVLAIRVPYGMAGRKIGVHVQVRYEVRVWKRCPECHQIAPDAPMPTKEVHEAEALVVSSQIGSVGERLARIASGWAASKRGRPNDG